MRTDPIELSYALSLLIAASGVFLGFVLLGVSCVLNALRKQPERE